jgi:hypothetical protein
MILTKRNQLGGNLLEIAKALGDGMSYFLIRTLLPCSIGARREPIAYHPALLSIHGQFPSRGLRGKLGVRTGTGLIIRAVCLMYICWVWRMNIMRVGCMAMALVTLNILLGYGSVVRSEQRG